MLAQVMEAIADEKADPGAVDVVRIEGKYKVRDITVNARDDVHSKKIVDTVKKIDGVQVHNVSDRVFLLHLGGKISLKNKVPVDTRDTLSMAYTPGVGRVCEDIAEDKQKAQSLTIKQNSIAVVTDGSAVLGLGNIGPEAAMPVMEGKAMLFKEFGKIDAYPICLDTQDVDEIVNAVKWIAPGFGGINLEDIGAPRCFEVEQRLKEELDIPVFHDDQHGTAIVTLAATINALKVTDKKMEDLRVAIVGAGAAGIAITRILLNAGVEEIVVCNRKGIISKNNENNYGKSLTWLAENTNPNNETGELMDATTDADLLIGVSGPAVVPREAIEVMAEDPIVFALANPVPEIMPEEIQDTARIIATGRSDYPNQINNVLAFPGLFRGALDARAEEINEEMKQAAAQAIANSIDDNDVSENYIIPSVFDKDAARKVSEKVKEAAKKSNVANE